MTTYTVTAERAGKWWVLQAEGAEGAISQVARLDQADEIIEAISFVTGEPESEISIDVRPVLPDGVAQGMSDVERLRVDAATANSDAAVKSRQVARALHAANITVRDIGYIMSVSHQRAHQLLNS